MMPVLRQLTNQPADMTETTVGANLADDGVTELPYQQLLAQVAQQRAGQSAEQSSDTLLQDGAEASGDMPVQPEPVVDNALLSPEQTAILASWSQLAYHHSATMAGQATEVATAQSNPALAANILQAATTNTPGQTVVITPVAAEPVVLPQPTVANSHLRSDITQTAAAVVLPVLTTINPAGSDMPLPEQPLPAQAMTSTATLQQFIRQAMSQRQAADTSPVTAATGVSGTNNSDTLFSWKAELPGQSSSAHNSQWSQKLVHLLADKINLQLGQQIQRAQIRLDPPQLGVIELSVSIDGERTHVQLYAANTQLREAMQHNLDQLRQQLAQRLGNDQMLNIDVRQQSQQQSGQHQTSQQQIAAAQFNELPDAAPDAAASTANATNWLNRLV